MENGDYYVWSPPGKPVRVAVSHRVIAGLRARIRALEPAAPEIGGILTGAAESDGGGGWQVTIAGFVAVETEYRFGPHFALSPKDRGRLKRQLARLPQPAVGFFRTHARKGLYLDRRDLSILQVFFPNPFDVFLAVEQDAGAMRAGFFIWEEGDVHQQAPYETFELATVAQEEMAPAPRSLAALPEPPFERDWRPWTRAAMVLALLLAVPLFSFHVGRWIAAGGDEPSSRSAPTAGFTLQAHPAGRFVRLNWDARDPLVRAAHHGRLVVTDGRATRELSLTPGNLAAGRFLYRPDSRSMKFELELYSAPPAAQGGAEPIRKVAAAETAFLIDDSPESAAGLRAAVRTEPVPPSGWRAALGSLFRAYSLDDENFVPARPPANDPVELPPDIRIRADHRIEALASIDPSGRVTRLTYNPQADHLLAELALARIERWRFTPATLDGSPVPSELRLHIIFPANRAEVQQ